MTRALDLPVPLNRTELFLAKIAGEDVTPPEPQSRQEMFLAKLAGADIVLPEPLSLTEQWLALCAGMAGVTAPEIEGACLIGVQKVDVRFFAVASGLDGVTAPEPQNRTEEFWAKIAEEMSVKTITVKGTNLHLLKVVSGIDDLQYVYGDTSQQTYTGKNLLINTFTTGSSNSVTATTNADGSVTLTGTSTALTWFRLAPNTFKVPAGTYTLSGGKGPVSGIAIYNNNFGIAESPVTRTLTEESTGDWSIRIASGTVTNTTVYPMLESGSTATVYEPYVGGTASPNPDYPQDVKVVTGEQTVNITTAQLLTKDGMATPRTDTDFWHTVADSVTLTPQTEGWARFSVTENDKFGNIFLKPAAVSNFTQGETYTVIAELANINVSAGYLDISSPSNNADPFSSVEMIYGTSSQSGMVRISLKSNQTLVVFKGITKSNTNLALRAYTRPNVPSGSSFDIRMTYLKGDHTTDYQNYCGKRWQPYQSQNYKIDLSHNLYNSSTNTTGKYLSNTGVETNSVAWAITDYIPVTAGKSYVYLGMTNAGNAPYSCYYNSSKNFVSSFKQAVGRNIITIPSGVSYVRFSVKYDEDIASFRFEDTPNQIELCKIGTYQDYIYKSGNDWYVHKECNKYIFSGSEGWSSGASEAASGYYGYYINTQDFLSEYQKGGKDTPVYMSKFAQIPYGYNIQQNGAMTNYAAPYLSVVSINLSTVSALKASLAGSTYYYALATPTDTQITDSTLISQLNALDSAILPTPEAFVTVSGNLPAPIQFTYEGKE